MSAESVRKQLLQRGRQCDCPTCGVSRSLSAIKAATAELDAATDAWLDQSSEIEGEFYFLRDEIEAALAAPRWKSMRKRLRKALDVARGGGD